MERILPILFSGGGLLVEARDAKEERAEGKAKWKELEIEREGRTADDRGYVFRETGGRAPDPLRLRRGLQSPQGWKREMGLIG